MGYKSFLFLILLVSLSWAQEDIVLEGQLPETVIGLPAVRQLGVENAVLQMLDPFTAAVLAKTSLDAEGKFKLALPYPIQPRNLALLDEILCPSETASKTGVFAAFVNELFILNPLSQTLASISRSTYNFINDYPDEADQERWWIYVSEDVSITGFCTQDDWPRINTQLELNRGWNLALVTYSSVTNSAVLMGLFSKQLVPVELPWQSSF